MADSAAPQKRVLPQRARRESKRLAYSPSPQAPAPSKTPTQTPTADSKPKRKYNKRTSLVVAPPTPSNGSASPAPEELLPTRFIAAGPLPSSRNKQPPDVSLKDYQSVADSAILAASLHRSRMQWLNDGIFKKYWVKPVKRKGVIDVPPNNPDAKTMQKMGNGTITIEPHRFDVTFYVVRDAQALVPSYYRPPPQPKPSTFSSPAPLHSPYPATPSNTRPAPSTPATSQPTMASLPLRQESGPASPSIASATATPMPTVTAPQAPPGPARPPAQKSGADPVIQMLAARAATNPQLKELMKVVATSKASQEQLKEFQKHIDELNEVAARQEAEREKQASPQYPVATPAQPVANKPQPSSASHPATCNPTPRATPTTAMPPPHYAPYPPQPRPELLIKHIIVEFLGEGTSPDRWLFPEYAVLDIRYGGLEMTVSYFVERKGSDIIKALAGGSEEAEAALQAKWKANTEYYQPVTMHVRANQHKTIETIARGAKTLPAVQEHMKNVMKEKTRAPEEYLVHHLPRDKPQVGFVDSAVEMGSDEEDDTLKDYYGS